MVADESYIKRSFEYLFEVFGTFSTELMVTDLDIPTNQRNILELMQDLDANKHTVFIHPYLLWMVQYITWLGAEGGVTAAVAANIRTQTTNALGPNATTAAVDAGVAAAMATPATKAAIKQAAQGALANAPYNMDFHAHDPFSDPKFNPQGYTLSNNSAAFYGVYHMMSDKPTDWTTFDTSNPQHMMPIYMDKAGSSTQIHKNDATRSFDIMRITMVEVDLTDESKFLDMIDDTENTVNKSPIGDNVYNYGPITVFWTVFLALPSKLTIMLLIDLGVIFLLTMLFLEFNVVAALVTSVSCVMISVQVYGLACALMSFNIFVAVFVLMAMGMSVEFVCHMAASFATGKKKPEAKLAESMKHTFPALLEGSLTTLIGILPLAFHPVTFYVKYLFAINAMVVIIGVINGFVILPSMLALLDISRWRK